MPAAASCWLFSPRRRQGLSARPRRAVGAPLGPRTVGHARGKAPYEHAPRGPRFTLAGAQSRVGAAQPPPNLLEAAPLRRQNRTPGERTSARGQGEGGYAGRSFEGSCVRFAFGDQAPPLWRYGSSSPLPLHGAPRTHSFRARPARYLRAPSAARRRHNVGPRRRDPVCHPDLPVRGAHGGRAGGRPGGLADPHRPHALPYPVPASAEPVTSGSRPPAAAGMLLRCHRAGSLPSCRRAGLRRISWAAPRSRRPFARGNGAAPFPGRGSERGPPRPAQLRPAGWLSMLGPHPRSH